MPSQLEYFNIQLENTYVDRLVDIEDENTDQPYHRVNDDIHFAI